jgi:hypothetical protein
MCQTPGINTYARIFLKITFRVKRIQILLQHPRKYLASFKR